MSDCFHSVKLIEENCVGCTKCMNKCPVEAIRLKNNKAVIYSEKCIDCGECIKVCPYKAHVADKTELSDIEKFKIKIVIPSVTIYSQFEKVISPTLVNEAMESLGFDEVVDITYACDIVSEITKRELEHIPKPAISPFCPSVVKLIETRYPDLIDHVIKVLPPIEIAASLTREKYAKMGYKDEEVGIFFLTPCAGWATRVRCTTSDDSGRIDGAIPICDVFPKLLKYISKNEQKSEEVSLSFTGLMWALPSGISKSMNLKEYIAVDGIQNVIRVLDDIEKGKLSDVEFIEADTCSGGCLGGISLIENPYNAKRITTSFGNKLNMTYKAADLLSDDYRQQFLSKVRSINAYDQKLADDFISAVKKMKYMNEIINTLPGIDCGRCGSPSCKAFAEDVVKELASIDECKMVKRRIDSNESK